MPQKASNIYAWVKFICLGLKPFCAVEDPITRDLGRYYDPISVNTLKKYMDLITTEEDKKIAFILPSKITIVIDGWTKQSTHFLGVFATFPA